MGDAPSTGNGDSPSGSKSDSGSQDNDSAGTATKGIRCFDCSKKNLAKFIFVLFPRRLKEPVFYCATEECRAKAVEALAEIAENGSWDGSPEDAVTSLDYAMTPEFARALLKEQKKDKDQIDSLLNCEHYEECKAALEQSDSESSSTRRRLASSLRERLRKQLAL